MSSSAAHPRRAGPDCHRTPRRGWPERLRLRRRVGEVQGARSTQAQSYPYRFIATFLEPGAEVVRDILRRNRGTEITYDPSVRPAIVGPLRKAVEGFEGALEVRPRPRDNTNFIASRARPGYPSSFSMASGEVTGRPDQHRPVNAQTRRWISELAKANRGRCCSRPPASGQASAAAPADGLRRQSAAAPA